MTHPERMSEAIDIAATARLVAAPNPWVGCIVVCTDGQVFRGATEAPGQRHAERVALDLAGAAGADTTGATVYTTLEPCAHHGRTPPCTDALIAAKVATVVSALADPDPRVAAAASTCCALPASQSSRAWGPTMQPISSRPTSTIDVPDARSWC